MSHFCVLVKLPPGSLDDWDVEAAVGELMEPYNENNAVEAHAEYDEDPDSILRMVQHYSWPFEEDEKWVDEEPGEVIDDHYVLAPGRAITVSQLRQLFAKHADDWSGCEMGIDAGGVFRMSTYNPDAKWDWYSIGGRWKGMIPIKPGTEQVLGDDGLGAAIARSRGEKVPEVPAAFADVALVKDFDVEKMRADAAASCREAWDKFLVLREAAKKPEEAWNEGERTLMRPYGFLTRLFETGIANRERLKTVDEYGPAEWGPLVLKDIANFDEFAKLYGGDTSFSTWAVLDDDGWHEQSRMGMFASHSGTPEELNEFKNTYMERHILNEDPETTLVMVDCHI